MRTVALEVALRKIRVNALCPGPVDDVFQNNIEEEASKMIGADATEMIKPCKASGNHQDRAFPCIRAHTKQLFDRKHIYGGLGNKYLMI